MGYLNNVLGKGLTMEINNFNNNNSNDNQFVISYELICLLQWIIEHESEQLKQLVQRAMQSGLQETIHADDGQEPVLEDIQAIIIDFFELCETLIAEVEHEQSVKKVIAKNLMPTIDQIDSQQCDDDTLRSSIDSITMQLDETPQKSAREVLYKEILKQWKPNKKAAIN